MASGMEHVSECSIRTLCGKQFIAEVDISWNIKRLRKYVCTNFGIPEYEQHFLRTSVRLLSSDLLCPSTSAQPNGRFEITLVRSSMPDCFSKMEVQECWHSFVTFSRDQGETVDGALVLHIARSANMDRILRALRAEPVIATTLSFDDLMLYFAQLNAKLPLPRALAAEGVVVDPMLLDVGRTTCPRSQAAHRLVYNQAMDEDEDSSDDDSYDDETEYDFEFDLH